MLEAVEFLQSELAAGPRTAADIEHAAGQNRITKQTLKRARVHLGIRPEKAGFHNSWIWQLAA
jgi:hypothetical protein